MTDMTPITYAAGAYTAAQAERPRPEENRQSRRFRLATRGQHLPRRQPTRDLFPMHELSRQPLARLREIEAMPGHIPRPEDRPAHPLRWDEECLRYTSQTKRNFFFGVIRGLGMVGFFCSIAVFILSVIVLFFASLSGFQISVSDYFSWAIRTYPLIGALCLMFWGGANLIYRLFPNFAAGWQPGPLWELNRRTGQVTVFATPVRHGNAWQAAHVLPFHEFDCYLQSTPSHQGLPQFNLILAHYSREAHVCRHRSYKSVNHQNRLSPRPASPFLVGDETYKRSRHAEPRGLPHDKATATSRRPPRGHSSPDWLFRTYRTTPSSPRGGANWAASQATSEQTGSLQADH